MLCSATFAQPHGSTELMPRVGHVQKCRLLALVKSIWTALTVQVPNHQLVLECVITLCKSCYLL